jgi:non-heme chloroperoxidase
MALRITLLAALCSIVGLQAAAPWQDTTAHRVELVTVEDGVQLEVVDWGGVGQAIVLLSGSGHTAHVFDDFAPRLLDCCHLYGITRRGYGASSRPASGYDDQRLADDVLRVLDRKQIRAPVLVGHSMAGGEMTTLGRQHSDRLAGLVYLDALGDLEDDPPADKEWLALQQQLPPGLQPPPTCEPVDRGSFAAYRRTSGCRMGFVLPESELHQAFEDVNGAVGPARVPQWVSRAIGQGQVFRRDYSGIRVPVLALMNDVETTEELLAASGYQPKDAGERERIDRFMARSRIVFGRFTAKLTRPVPTARIVKYPLAGHYLFITREADVLREVHAFVAGLQARADRAPACPADWPALPAGDPSYAQAVDLARSLTERGVLVVCFAPSTMTQMFEGQEGAVLYRTDRGDFEALFLPPSQRFDELRIVERREGGRYLYSFAGQPKPWPANLIDAARPVYFFKHVNRLLVTNDKDLIGQLQSVLAGH